MTSSRGRGRPQASLIYKTPKECIQGRKRCFPVARPRVPCIHVYLASFPPSSWMIPVHKAWLLWSWLSEILIAFKAHSTMDAVSCPLSLKYESFNTDCYAGRRLQFNSNANSLRVISLGIFCYRWLAPSYRAAWRHRASLRLRSATRCLFWSFSGETVPDCTALHNSRGLFDLFDLCLRRCWFWPASHIELYRH